MKGYVEHLISSSEEIERELSRDFDEMYFKDKPVILCFGIGENTVPVIFKLEDSGIERTLFIQMTGIEESITDHHEILTMDDYGLYDVEYEGEIKLPFLSVFLIDFTEDVDIEKVRHFMNETLMTFPYSNIVVMSVIPSGENRSRAITKCKKISSLCDTMFIVDKNRMSSMYPDCNDSKLHIKSLTFLARQFKNFAEMILLSGKINIDWYDVFGFVVKSDEECNKALYFTSSGSNPEEIVDSLLKEISRYRIDEDNVIVDVVSSDPSLGSDAVNSLKKIESFNFIWGYRDCPSMKKNFVRINVFARKK